MIRAKPNRVSLIQRKGGKRRLPPQKNDRLRRDLGITLVFFVGLLGWFCFENPYAKTNERLVLATMVSVGGFAPLFYWLWNRERGRLPVFHIHCVFYGIAFGIAGFYPDVSTLTQSVDEAFMIRGQVAALTGLGLLMGGYAIGRQCFRSLSPRPSPIHIPPSGYNSIAVWVYPGFLVAAIATRIIGIGAFAQPLGAIQQFLILFLSGAWVAGKLKGPALVLFLGFYLPIQLIDGLVGGAIAGFVSTVIALGILIVSLRGRVPWLAIACAGSVFVLLQPVKDQYREIFWTRQVEASRLEKLEIFFELGFKQFDSSGPVEQNASPLEESTLTTVSRINHLHVTGAVIRDTPASQPFRYGATYLPLFTKLIPRALWPGKPDENLGNEWGRAYGYLGKTDFKTSFNLPWLTEMFINFGWWGVGGGSFLVGGLLALLHRLYLDRPVGLVGIAFGMAITRRLLFVESHFSLSMGAVLIGIFTLYAVGFLTRGLWGEQTSRKRRRLSA